MILDDNIELNNENLKHAILSNDINKICKHFTDNPLNETMHGTNIYFYAIPYLRGYYFWLKNNNSSKVNKLMKYNNPFAFLLNCLGYIYYRVHKFYKAIYYLEKPKYNHDQEYRSNIILYTVYNNYKKLYYILKNRYNLRLHFYILKYCIYILIKYCYFDRHTKK